MKTILHILIMLSIALLFSGCATRSVSADKGGGQKLNQALGATVVRVMYGRSGVFVKNNYDNLIIVARSNNNVTAKIEPGQTAQFYTVGLVNHDEMSIEANFYDKAGDYVGYDEYGTHVYYSNGSPFVRNWEPRVRETRTFERRR